MEFSNYVVLSQNTGKCKLEAGFHSDNHIFSCNASKINTVLEYSKLRCTPITISYGNKLLMDIKEY